MGLGQLAPLLTMADTLLDMVQDILAEMDGDFVNSITDTAEAMQVAGIVRTVFKDMVEEHDIPGRSDLISLEGVADPTRPTHMKIPDAISRIEWIKYDTRIDPSGNKAYANISYMCPLDFITYTNARPSTDTVNYQVVQYSANTPIIVGILVGPKFWTSFDDKYIVMDSFNSNVDSTLQASKSLSQGYSRPTLTIADATVPNIPENLFRQLYSQALSRCFVDLKTVVNQKAERAENRFRVRNQRNKWRRGRVVNDTHNWGRK